MEVEPEGVDEMVDFGGDMVSVDVVDGCDVVDVPSTDVVTSTLSVDGAAVDVAVPGVASLEHAASATKTTAAASIEVRRVISLQSPLDECGTVTQAPVSARPVTESIITDTDDGELAPPANISPVRCDPNGSRGARRG